MSATIDKYLVRTFIPLIPTITAGEAFVRLGGRMRGGTRYGIIVDAQGQPLSCVSTVTVQGWPEDLPLQALEASWPPLLLLAEAEAIGIDPVARFFGPNLGERQDIPAIVLANPAGQPAALVPRYYLEEVLSQEPNPCRDFTYGPPPPPPAFTTERDLKVKRWGRMKFPSQVVIGRPEQLAVSINREEAPGQLGQAELSLTAPQWPVRVIATVKVTDDDFRIAGPASQVIEVPRMADSAIALFTLTPLRPGEKTVRVKFEQNSTYLGTARLTTEVVTQLTSAAADALVSGLPQLAAVLDPPDMTLYVEKDKEGLLKYAMRVRRASDAPGAALEELGSFEFPRDPEPYVESLFAELDAKAKGSLSATDFDEMVRKIGSSLFDMLSKGNNLRTFYWEHMHGQVKTVQIVSEEPYIPWEIVWPNRRLPDGRADPASSYLCQSFALSRWLDGPSPVDRVPLHTLTLVLPPSNLRFVEEEAEALQSLPGLTVQTLADKPALEQFLRSGETQVLHFACHGKFYADLPDRSAVILGKDRWRAFELTDDYRNFGRTQPLVFLNTCDTGRVGFGLTGLSGWAEAFLESGAGVFLGAMWNIDDELASEFACRFYEQITAGAPVGDAVRAARDAIRRSGDATYLSYTLYANPTIHARIAGS